MKMEAFEQEQMYLLITKRLFVEKRSLKMAVWLMVQRNVFQLMSQKVQKKFLDTIFMTQLLERGLIFREKALELNITINMALQMLMEFILTRRHQII